MAYQTFPLLPDYLEGIYTHRNFVWKGTKTCNFGSLQESMMNILNSYFHIHISYWIWKQNKLRGPSSAARLLLIQNDQFLNLSWYHVDLKDENLNCLLFMYSSGSTLDWYLQAVVSEEFPEDLVNISRTNPWPFVGPWMSRVCCPT